MIKYPISEHNLHRKIDQFIPAQLNKNGVLRKNGKQSWMDRAESEKRQLSERGNYIADETQEIWSELKSIFSELQGDGKCAYCERKLHIRGSGRIDGDIDHYRPKNGVREWKTSESISTGRSDDKCYYQVAYNPRNYILSCRVCNEDMKKNYFPIAGTRCSSCSNKEEDLNAERPYLIHPLDPADDDPEELIQFIGVVPVPIAPTETHNYWRAKFTIELFKLTGGNRLDLDMERIEIIKLIYLALCNEVDCPDDPVVRKILNDLNSNELPHRNCARSFARLYRDKPIEAEKIINEIL